MTEDENSLRGYADIIGRAIEGPPAGRVFLLGKLVSMEDIVREVSRSTKWGKMFAQELEEIARIRGLTVKEFITGDREGDATQTANPAQVDSPEG